MIWGIVYYCFNHMKLPGNPQKLSSFSKPVSLEKTKMLSNFNFINSSNPAKKLSCSLKINESPLKWFSQLVDLVFVGLHLQGGGDKLVYLTLETPL